MALTVAQLVARLTADTSGFYRGMALANSSMIRTGGIVTRVAAGVGLATLGMGIMSVRAAGNFQQSMNILGAVSEATEGQLKALRNEAIDLGRDMKLPNVSAKDAAEAMQELAKGGLSVKDIMSATRGTLQLGIAANMGFADSATVVARSLTAFGLDGSKATMVADLFTAAANKSTASMTDIALGFQMASAQFAAGNQSISGLTTSLTLMANAGIVGSDAGTSLKTMMNRLMAPTKKASGLMKSLGFEAYDSSGNMKQMPDIIGDLNYALRGMSNAQRDATLYTLFGSDAIRAARVMMDKGEKGWRNMEKRITKGGEAQKFAEATTAGFNGSLQALWSSIETVAIALGTPLLDPLEKVARAMANWINNINTDKIIEVATAVFEVIGAIISFVAESDILVSIIGGLIAGFVAFGIITWVVGLVEALIAVVGALSVALLANPAVLIAAALIALGVALVIAYQRSETFRAIVDRAFAAVKSAAKWVWEAMKTVANAFQTAYNATKSAVTSIVNAVRSAWNFVKNTTTAIWDTISGFFRRWWPLLLVIFALPLAVIFALVNRYWRQVWEVTQTIFNAIKGVVKAAWSAITGAVRAGVAAVKGVVTAGFNAVKAAIIGPLRAVIGLVKGVLSSIGGALSAAIGTLAGIAREIGSAIAHGIADGITGAAGAIAGAAKSAAKSALDGAKSFLGVGSPSKRAANEVGKPIAQGIIQGFLLGSADLPAKVKDRLRRTLEAGKAMVDTYREKMKRGWDRIAGDALKAFDAITAAHQTKTESWINQQDDWYENARMGQRYNKAVQELQELEADPTSLISDIEDARFAVEEADWAIRRKQAQLNADAERKEYDASRDLQKRHLEDYLDEQWNALSKSPKQWETIMGQTMTTLEGYGVTFKSAGRFLGESFGKGMEEAQGVTTTAAQKMAKLIAKYLKLKSPAEAGPLSDLHRWWTEFGPTLLAGLDPSAVRNELAAMVAPPGVGYTPGVRAPAGGGGTVVINNPVFLTDDRDTARRIAETVEPYIGIRPTIGPGA